MSDRGPRLGAVGGSAGGTPEGNNGRKKYSGVPSPPCSLHIDPPTAALSGSQTSAQSGRRDGGPVLLGQPEGSLSGAQRPSAASPLRKIGGLTRRAR